MRVLTRETHAGERPLLSAAEAQANLIRGIRAGYQGTYRGTYCQFGGEPGGEWTMQVGPNGEVSIAFRGTPAFIYTGTMDLTGYVEIHTANGSLFGGFSPTFNGIWDNDLGQIDGVFYSGSARCGNPPSSLD